MLIWLVRRQHAFVRSLGNMKMDPDGIYRSDSIVAPLLLGAIWAAQPEVALPGTSARLIAVNMKWWINGADMLQPGGPSATRDIRVVSGKEFVRKVSFGEGRTYETQCVASLSNADRKSSVWKTAESTGQRVEGLVLLECKLVENGKVFATPAVLTADSKVATIEMANQDGTTICKLELNASTLPATRVRALISILCRLIPTGLSIFTSVMPITTSPIVVA
jgi:hypothetical protein